MGTGNILLGSNTAMDKNLIQEGVAILLGVCLCLPILILFGEERHRRRVFLVSDKQPDNMG